MFHERKLILLHLIQSTLGISLKFHSKLDFDDSEILTFPSFYINNISVIGASTFLLQLLFQIPFYHKQFGIKSKLIYVEEFAKQNIIFLYDLFNAEDGFKTR